MTSGSLALLAGGLFLLPLPQADIVNLADQHRLQGKWTVVKWYVTGMDGTNWAGGEAIEEFKGTTKLVTATKDPATSLRYEFRLDATTSPKRIIIIWEGIELRGIYEFERDTLRIALSYGKQFPKNFRPNENDEVSILRFHRK